MVAVREKLNRASMAVGSHMMPVYCWLAGVSITLRGVRAAALPVIVHVVRSWYVGLRVPVAVMLDVIVAVAVGVIVDDVVVVADDVELSVLVAVALGVDVDVDVDDAVAVVVGQMSVVPPGPVKYTFETTRCHLVPPFAAEMPRYAELEPRAVASTTLCTILFDVSEDESERACVSAL